MATPNIDSLFPLLLPQLPECPLDTVRLNVRRACRQFCRGSTAWRVLLDPIAMVENVGKYALTLPDHTTLVLICNVYPNAGELTGKTLDQLRQVLPDWQNALGRPTYFNGLDYVSLSVYPKPYAAYAGQFLTPRVALAPSLDVADLPGDLTSRYDETIAAGALEFLYGIAAQPWTNAAMVPTQHGIFAHGIHEARIAIEHERVKGSLHVQPRVFGS